jgi:hypothetical protein
MERLKAALSVLADDGATIVDLAEDILKDQGESTGEMSPPARGSVLIWRKKKKHDGFMGRSCMSIFE